MPVCRRTSPATGQSQRAGSCLRPGTGWAAGIGGAEEARSAAWAAEAEAEPGLEGAGGSAGGSDAAGAGAEPDSGLGGGGGGGGELVSECGKGSPLGWSLVLYRRASRLLG